MLQEKTKNSILENQRLFTLCFAAFAFMFWALIFYLSPMTEDDNYFWSLRLTDFDSILSFSLNYGNGRLLGNLGIFYMVEHKLLRVLVKAAVMCAITMLLPMALRLRGRAAYPLSLLLLSLAAPRLFAQVYTWTSGFQNYVPPLLLQLFIPWLILSLGEKRPLLCAAIVLIPAMAMQLYVEHSTVITVLMALCFCAYAFKCRRRLLPACLVWLAASLAGLVLMLLIPELSRQVLVDMGAYKGSVLSLGPAGALVAMVKNFIVMLANYSQNVFLLAALGLLTLLQLRKNAPVLKMWEQKLLPPGLTVPLVFMLLGNVNSSAGFFGDLAVVQTLALALAMGLWLLSFLWSVFRLTYLLRSSGMYLLSGLVLFALLSAAPSLVVQPLVSRMSFQSYLFLCAACLLLFDMAELKNRRPVLAALCATSLVVSVALGVLFMDIDRMTHIREEHIRAAVEAGESEIEYFMVPSDYVFDYFDQTIYSMYYQSLYNADVQLSPIPAEVWLDSYYYMK